MVRRRPSVSSTSSPSLPVKRNSGQPERDTFNLDGFVSSVYLPHIRLRKRSWRVDERIARQHLSPTFEHGNLPTYNATKWKTGCTDCRPAVWLRPPATAFWRSSRQFALWP